jgi:DNA polymerase I
LFVCFAAHAELGCHMALGWPLPRKILDLSPEFRGLVNGCTIAERKGLLGALAYFGLDNIGTVRKDAMRTRIMQGWPFSAQEREQVLRYCLSDVEGLERLLPALLPHIDLPTALYRSEFVAASAKMEQRGVPIDMAIFPRLADKRTWAAIRDTMVR